MRMRRNSRAAEWVNQGPPHASRPAALADGAGSNRAGWSRGWLPPATMVQDLAAFVARAAYGDLSGEARKAVRVHVLDSWAVPSGRSARKRSLLSIAAEVCGRWTS